MAKNSPISTFGMRLVKAIIAAVVVVLCSRWLNADGRGVLSVTLFWLHMIILVHEMVGGSPIANLIRNKPIGSIVPAVWIWSILTGIFGGTMLFFFTNLPVFWILLIYFPLAWLGTHYNYYQGLSKVFIRNNLQVLLEVLKLLVLLVYYLLSPLITVVHVLVVYAITHILVYAISRWVLRPFFALAKQEMTKPPKILFSFGITNQMAAILQFLSYRIGVVLLANYVSDAEAGVFSNVLLIADTVWIFANSFGTIAHMKILASNNETYVARLVSKYVSISLMGTLLACFLIVLVPSSFYAFVFGADFSGMRAISLAAIPGILALGFSTVMAHYLHAINRFNLLVLSSLCGLSVQLICHYILLKELEGLGAGIALSVGLVISAIVLFIFTSKILGKNLVFKPIYEFRLIKNMIKIMFYK